MSEVLTITSLTQEGRSVAECAPEFIASVYNKAALLDTGNNANFGLLGAVMTDEQYDEIDPGNPWNPLVKPPPIAPDDNEAQIDVRKQFVDSYEAQMKAMSTLGALCASCFFFTL